MTPRSRSGSWDSPSVVEPVTSQKSTVTVFRTWSGNGPPTASSLPPAGAVEVVAKDVVSAGGSAKAAEVDALDEQAVDKHLQSVIDQAGRVDISFNAVGIPYCLPYMRNTEYYDPSCYSGGALDLAPRTRCGLCARDRYALRS